MDVDAELYGNPATTETTTTTTTSTSEPAENAEGEKKEMVSFTLNFNKQNYPLEWPLDDTILNLKNEIFNQTRVPVPLQKLMFKGAFTLFTNTWADNFAGLVKDNGKTLRELGIGKGAKLMLIGSTMTQVMEVNAPPQVSVKEDEGTINMAQKIISLFDLPST